MTNWERRVHSAGLYHRGWRFWPPFACNKCGLPIRPAQFHVGRQACEQCYLTGRTSRKHHQIGFYILGKVQLENACDKNFFTPQFIVSLPPAQSTIKRGKCPETKDDYFYSGM